MDGFGGCGARPELFVKECVANGLNEERLLIVSNVSTDLVACILYTPGTARTESRNRTKKPKKPCTKRETASEDLL